MGRFHRYVPKMHPLYRCAGTASHIGDFPDYACYVAVLFLPDRVSVMELLKRGVVRISDTNIPAQPPHRPPEHAAPPELHTKASSTNDRTATNPFIP